MAGVAVQKVIHRLRQLSLGHAERDDGELLECFLRHSDAAAFTALVERHGPMVLGVCRRVLQHRHDAEDAFQATFLVLVRKGHAIVPRDRVGRWLYGVACRTALEARRAAAKRRQKERAMPRVTQVGEPDRDLQALLDEELNALPEKYRDPIVLCDLEGKTRQEAARQLRCPDGTVAGRLARARCMLARRLARRGLVLSGGAVAAYLSENAGLAAVPAPLAASTIEAAGGGFISASVAALTEGVLRTMFLAKLKTIASCVLAFSFLTAASTMIWQNTRPSSAQAASQLDSKNIAPEKDPPKKADPKDAKKDATKDDKKEAPKDGAFSKIHVKQGKVVITQTGKQSFEAKGDPIFVNNAKTSVENGTLHLEGFNVEFNVEVKDLSALTIEGLGSADLKNLKCKHLEITVNGGAKVVASGSADELVIDVSGIGSFNGEACKGKQATVKVDGNGQAAVNVTDKLKADIQGIGRLYYLGTPAIEKEVGFNGQLLQGPAPANFGGGFGGIGGIGFERWDRRFGAPNRLGIALTAPNDALIDQLDLPKGQGLVIGDVGTDSAAAKAGLKNHDVLLEFDGKKVSSKPAEFHKLLGDFKTGAKVDAVVLRKGKKETIKEVTLPETPKGFGPGIRGVIRPLPPLPPQFQPGGLLPNPPAPKKENKIPDPAQDNK